MLMCIGPPCLLVGACDKECAHREPATLSMRTTLSKQNIVWRVVRGSARSNGSSSEKRVQASYCGCRRFLSSRAEHPRRKTKTKARPTIFSQPGGAARIMQRPPSSVQPATSSRAPSGPGQTGARRRTSTFAAETRHGEFDGGEQRGQGRVGAARTLLRTSICGMHAVVLHSLSLKHVSIAPISSLQMCVFSKDAAITSRDGVFSITLRSSFDSSPKRIRLLNLSPLLPILEWRR